MQKQLAIKMLIILVVGMLVLVPTSMVKYKINERQGHLDQAKAAVAQGWTGSQLLTTPVLVIPYQLSGVSGSGFYTEGELAGSPLQSLEIILPDHLRSDITIANKTVFKGIYGVGVYNSKAEISGVFSAEIIQQHLTAIRQAPRFERFGQPYLSVSIADVRGIDQSPALTANTVQVPLSPGSGLAALSEGLHGELDVLSEPAVELNFTLSLSLQGMGSFSFIQLADDASTRIRSDWPHPEFTGATLPVERQISASGFEAGWASTRFSSNGAALLEECIGSGSCKRLLASSSGVNFIDPVDVYLQSERSVKYAVLFIGLSFITFFIFEQLKQIRIHPMQYGFVGLAIATFYLLLISLAEHIEFYQAYSIAVVCCSALLLFYVRYMLKSFRSALLFSAMIVGLYGLLYVIVQAEDFALLMGAILVFIALAILMYVTRHIDWYTLAIPED